MDQKQSELIDKIKSLKEQLTEMQNQYWQLYSNMGTWQFWVILLMFTLPLVALYFLIDRRKMLLLGFYGFNIHIWFGYINVWGYNRGLWEYPYELVPFLPGNLALDASLIPVLFMLVYQWTLNHRKNYYLYTLGLSAFLSFIFKPFLVAVHLFELDKGTTYIHLFIAYCVIFLFSKLITSIFLKMQKS
ncbi:CBO0543 family protein [Halalkalibacter urbisdiaboli]|uniref:CBO0543 family protein n=1 Tax=Halalkalibacter urbisdiaboli TaxID=1960589 RepID=UPI000B438E55|nr:CBO0543 family protein [Halalkalibacter urbisdiaboli]